jgi:hypothetical protein
MARGERIWGWSEIVSQRTLRNHPGLTKLEAKYRQPFGTDDLKHTISLSFAQLQINPMTFRPSWNRNFTIQGNSLRGERRGDQGYRRLAERGNSGFMSRASQKIHIARDTECFWPWNLLQPESRKGRRLV